MKVKVCINDDNRIYIQIFASNGEQLARSKSTYHSSLWAEIMEDALNDVMNSKPEVKKAGNDEYTWESDFFVCSETYVNKSHTEKMIEKIFN